MNLKSMVLVIGAACFSMFIFGAVISTALNAQNESSIIASPSFSPPVFSFQKNLRFGDDNQDVRQLQIFLNNESETRISGSGIGSKGQESIYFGALTANAVVRFQTKYGISSTGFVGPLTRAKLNQLIQVVAQTAVVSVSTSTTSVVSGPLPFTKEKLPRLYAVYPQQIKNGGTISLVGAGFQSTNTIHIGSNVFSGISPQDDSNISFVVPSTVQNGAYEVWVENVKGSSLMPDQPINLTIANNLQPAVIISSVAPASETDAGAVTITGSGFSPAGNDIVSGFGTIKNILSDGNQISFSPKSLLAPEVLTKIPTGTILKIDFYVVNANGASNIFGSVNLKI